MKYAFLIFLLICCGCVETPTAPSQVVAPNVAKPWGGLDVETRGAALENATQVTVILHGYGAPGTDLVSFADYLAADGRAFVFPAAPIELDSGGLAWATLESEVETSLRSVQSLIAYIHREYPNAEISVGGFSQGASMSSMLVDSATPISHLILFSPGLFLEETPKPTNTGPAVYISHGMQDDVLPFSDAQKLKLMLSKAGFDVRFTAFEGGHTIPAEVLDEAKMLLDGAE